MLCTDTDAYEHHQTSRNLGYNFAVHWRKRFNEGRKDIQLEKETSDRGGEHTLDYCPHVFCIGPEYDITG
jgi:hypothetical protein